MKKQATKFSALALTALSAISPALYGCRVDISSTSSSSTSHEHEYSWYVAREATCSVEGIMEGVCETCGKKIFSEIEKLEHTFQEGFCSVCETAKTDDLIKIQNTEIGWSFDEIYERSFLLKLWTNKEEFTNDFTGITLKNFSVTDSGNIKITSVKYDYEYNATLRNIREDLKMQGQAKGYVHSISITKAGRLEITLADGTFEDYGYLASLQADPPENAIERIVVNLQNEMILIHKNGTAKRVGVLPSDDLNTEEGVLVYLKQAGSDVYSIYGAMSSDLTAVSIPTSHRGKIVKSIRCAAFASHTNLKTVFVPASVKTIGAYAFPRGTKIFTDATSVPSGWDDQVLVNCPFYLAGRWEWIDGIPTPIE